ncbi:MAG: LPS export ABC transporter periplasmic protein LptC [Deltaproteobacteria bacterium]|nr:LPS export ABC transporter periplasmic protein LptC [Deltaproteobacteria bacterium]MBW2137791.1 LPS export ABC transporter periplasmic protein LptC [Deltaproteobacteria bacterium]
MKNRFLKKHWPVLGILLVLGAVAFYLFGSGADFFAKRGLTILSDGFLEEGIKLENISYTQDNPEEKLRWTLDAKEVTFSKDRQFMTFKDFRLKLETTERPSLRLEGKRGEYDRKSGLITLRDDLKGYTDNGYSFFTDLMVYNNKEGTVKTDKPIRIVGPFFSVTGQGLTLSLEREVLQVHESITTIANRAVDL